MYKILMLIISFFFLSVTIANASDLKKGFNFFENQDILNPVVLAGKYDKEDFEWLLWPN